MLIALFQGISFSMAPLLGIGPFKIFVLSEALQHGWRKTLRLALAPLLADVPVILLLWFVLQQLPTSAVNILRIIGCVFYLFLAYRILRNARRTVSREDLAHAPQSSFLQAILAVWVNPVVYLNWSTIGIPAILLYAGDSLAHVAAFLLGFYLLWVGGLALQIYIVGRAGDVSRQANTLLAYAAAALLLWFGLYQGWLGGSAIFSGI